MSLTGFYQIRGILYGFQSANVWKMGLLEDKIKTKIEDGYRSEMAYIVPTKYSLPFHIYSSKIFVKPGPTCISNSSFYIFVLQATNHG